VAEAKTGKSEQRMTKSLDQHLLDEQPARSSARALESSERNVRLDDQALLSWAERLYRMHHDGGGFEKVKADLNDLHPADVADLIELVNRDVAVALVEQLGAKLQPALWPALDPILRGELIDLLPPEAVSLVVAALETDDAVEVLEDLSQKQQDTILEGLAASDRWAVKDALRYPEYSAGRLMAREVVALPKDWTVGHAVDFMRISDDLPDNFYEVFLIDAAHRPVGQLALSKILRTKRHVKLEELVAEEMTLVSPTMDQEELAHQFRQYGLVSAPIVEDDSGRLIGVVTVDDVVHVIDEEAEDDLMKLVGMNSGERDVKRGVRETARNRFLWLAVNLGTAVAASVIIGIFQDTIQTIVALAVLMPIVASMGGNAGTQTLAVMIRAIAMKDLRSTRATAFVRRELLVGLLNGVGFALIAAVLAFAWFQRFDLSIIIAVAMLVNLIIAGLSGTLVPLALNRLGIDPANASSVFLTTITDIVGFLAFLGLAALFL